MRLNIVHAEPRVCMRPCVQGTSYYHIHHNVCFYGGHKSDFDGHSKVSTANLHIHPAVYGVKCLGELQALPKKGFAEGYHNNTCILPTAGAMYMRLADCTPQDPKRANGTLCAWPRTHTASHGHF